MAPRRLLVVLFAALVLLAAQDSTASPEDRLGKPEKKPPEGKDGKDDRDGLPPEDEAPGLPLELPALFATNPGMPFPAGVPWGALGLPWKPLKIRLLFKDRAEVISVPRIVRALGARSPVVRKRLVLLLARLAENDTPTREEVKDALPALMVLIRNREETETVRLEAIKILARFRAVEQAEALVRGIRETSGPSERRVAIATYLDTLYFNSAIDAEGKKKMFEALEGAVLDPAPEVQVAASEALEKIDNQRNRGKALTARLRVKSALVNRILPGEVARLISSADPTLEASVDPATNVIEVKGSLKAIAAVLRSVQISTGTGSPVRLEIALEPMAPRKNKKDKDKGGDEKNP